jgi:hypothetical protein
MKKNVMCALVASVVLVGVGSTVFSVVSANADEQKTYTATLAGSVGSADFWDGNASTTSVTGDGSYTLTFDFDEATESTANNGAIILSTDINPYEYVEDATGLSASEVIEKSGIVISVDSVLVDGKAVQYTQSSGAYCMNDDGKTLRLNIYNVWGSNVKDIDFDFTVEESITVNFSISGLGYDKTTEEETTTTEPEVTTTADTEVTTTGTETDVTDATSVTSIMCDFVTSTTEADVTTTAEVDTTTAEADVTTTAEADVTTTAGADVTTEAEASTTTAESKVTTAEGEVTTTVDDSDPYKNFNFDVDGDGQVNIMDLIFLKKKILGII